MRKIINGIAFIAVWLMGAIALLFCIGMALIVLIEAASMESVFLGVVALVFIYYEVKYTFLPQFKKDLKLVWIG